MWNNASIVRSTQGLKNGEQELHSIESVFNNKFSKEVLTPEILEFKNMLCVAKLITRCALLRKESRGLHYREDYPMPDDANFLFDTIITKNEID